MQKKYWLEELENILNMKNNVDISELFRTRLCNTQMEVREGFWEQLQTDLPKSQLGMASDKKRIRLGLYKISVAASVLLLLGLSSVTAWYFSQKEEIKQAFTQIQNYNPRQILSLEGNLPAGDEKTNASQLIQAFVNDSSVVSENSDNQLTVSFTFTMNNHVYNSDNHRRRCLITTGAAETDNQLFPDSAVESGGVSTFTSSGNADIDERDDKKWALKASIGSAMPKGRYCAPIMVGVSVERHLTEMVSLEAGLQYQNLLAQGTQESWNLLAIPMKINVILFQKNKWMCYASAGGSMEKVLAKSFDEDPLRLSVLAGLGVSYKINDRFAVFAEPMFSHHFHTDTHIRNLRTERATNMNLLCGVRMIF